MNGAAVQRPSQFASASASDPMIPYWKFHFPNRDFNPSDSLVLKIDSWSRRLAARGYQGILDSIQISGPQTDRGIGLSYQFLLEVLGEEFARDFDEVPETAIACLSVALRSLAVENSWIGKLTARILEYPVQSLFKDMKANSIGKFVKVKGTAVRVGPIRPIIYQMAFKCLRCHQTSILQLPDGTFRVPTRCPTYNCPGKQFVPDRASPETLCRNIQRIKIQEILNEDLSDCGRIPRTLECELKDDLVDSIAAGENVVVSGILRVLDDSSGGGKGRKSPFTASSSSGSTGYSLTLSLNSISGSKKSIGPSTAESASTDLLTPSEREAILAIAQGKSPFKLLVDSLCPDIFGHELVKAGMLLALFRGREGTAGHSALPGRRANPHILIIGDPGLGKSQMLSRMAAVAPRAVFVGANTSTAAGLTATLHQEGGPGEYALEAGALVLADQGCCCIDEFDKLPEHRMLLDVMEQQVVNVAKAGVVCSLPARTSIIAAANPIGGHYNHQRSLHQNIRMNPALLSRFDLIFVLLDRPDQEIDKYLSERILAKLSKSNGGSNSSTKVFQMASVATAAASEALEDDFLHKLIRKQAPQNGQGDLIPISLLRKYVSHAQRHISPKLSSEAALVLKEFYLTCRRRERESRNVAVDYSSSAEYSHHSAPLPITTRQLESAIRLAEARAKAELRSIVTKQDAEDIVALMSYCMFECYKGGDQQVDSTNNPTSSGKTKNKSKPAVIKEFTAELNKISANTGNSSFSLDQLNQLYSSLFPPSPSYGTAMISFTDLLEALNHHGYVIRKPGNIYKLCLL